MYTNFRNKSGSCSKESGANMHIKIQMCSFEHGAFLYLDLVEAFLLQIK
jgi:hypothetical protein